MTGVVLSNRMADLAERAGEAFRLGRARSVEAAHAYIQCGLILAEAKTETGHGQWLPFLERADIPPRTAQRMMKLAATGMDAETLADKGVKAALADLSRPAKNDTVTHLETADWSPADRARARRDERRALGQCVDCGQPAGGKARCERCRNGQSRRDKRTRSLARRFKAITPRLEAAAQKGRGVHLSAHDVTRLIVDGQDA